MNPGKRPSVLERDERVDLGTRLLGLNALELRTDIKVPTWRAWLRQGRLAHIKLGRRILVSESDLADFLAAHRRPAR
jgi:excisionase family DNA binding protein